MRTVLSHWVSGSSTYGAIVSVNSIGTTNGGAPSRVNSAPCCRDCRESAPPPAASTTTAPTARVHPRLHVRVADQQGLHVVLTARQLAQVVQWIRRGAGVDDHRGARARRFDIYAERCWAAQQVEQQARLRLGLLRNRDDQATRDRAALERARKCDLEARSARSRRDGAEQGGEHPEQRGCQPVGFTHANEDEPEPTIRHRGQWRNAIAHGS